MKIESPRIIVFENDGRMQTHLYSGDWGYKEYGILIADIVRHVANAFRVREEEVWEWVDKERDKPTSPIMEIKPN